MTARVIGDVAADVLAVVEAEDRPSLARFNDELLAGRYGHCMLIDGNDTRGIDVGIMTTHRVEIASMRIQRRRARPASPASTCSAGTAPSTAAGCPAAPTVWVLVNHFKSQSGGGGAPSAPARPTGSATIVDRLVAAGERNIVVMGDLNEGPTAPDSRRPTCAALFDPAGPLVDVYSLPVFDPGPGRAPSRAAGSATGSTTSWSRETLAALVTGGGIERHGLWGTPTNVNPPAALGRSTRRSPRAEHAASDHAAVYIDIDLIN